MVSIAPLVLERCPYCNVADPNLTSIGSIVTTETPKQHESAMSSCFSDFQPCSQIVWVTYQCQRCKNMVLGCIDKAHYGKLAVGIVGDFLPKLKAVSNDIPEQPRNLLKEALESPSNAKAVMAATALDSTLNEKGFTVDAVESKVDDSGRQKYRKGDLYNRIKCAADEHLITADMSDWAHTIRLFANSRRHIDPLDFQSATLDEANEIADFATLLLDIIFVIPARVQRFKNNRSQ